MKGYPVCVVCVWVCFWDALCCQRHLVAGNGMSQLLYGYGVVGGGLRAEEDAVAALVKSQGSAGMRAHGWVARASQRGTCLALDPPPPCSCALAAETCVKGSEHSQVPAAASRSPPPIRFLRSPLVFASAESKGEGAGQRQPWRVHELEALAGAAQKSNLMLVREGWLGGRACDTPGPSPSKVPLVLWLSPTLALPFPCYRARF
jgi:hypothetical protein